MYRKDILEHYKHPENFGDLDPNTLCHHGENPLCGDTLQVSLLLDEEGTLTGAKFKGQGCAISQAATDILLCEIKGKSADEILAMERQDLIDLLGIEVSSLRVKCALLPLATVQDGLRIHRGEMDAVDVTVTDD